LHWETAQSLVYRRIAERVRMVDGRVFQIDTEWQQPRGRDRLLACTALMDVTEELKDPGPEGWRATATRVGPIGSDKCFTRQRDAIFNVARQMDRDVKHGVLNP
jgi:hypothetical protein